MLRRFALLAVALFAAPLFAGPTADVLKLVPPKSTICFVIQDLKGTAGRLGESPFAAHFAESKLGQSLLASDELKQIAGVETVLSEHLGLTLAGLRDDILGDAVVYAYQPPPEGKPDTDAGVVIGKAAKPDVLAKVVAKLNAVQTQSEELKATADKTHAGIGYVERQKADGRTEYYLLRDDGVFVYTVQEAVIKQVIDRLAGTDKTATPLATAFGKLGATDATAVLLFEPKAFAADLAAQEKATGDANQKAFLKQFAKLWLAAEAVGVSLTFDTHATLAVTAVATPEKVPAELRSLFKPEQTASGVRAAIPDDALLAVGGRFEWDTVSRAFESFLSDEGKGGLKQIFDDVLGPLVGKDLLPKVLAGLGPDWGLWLTAPAKGDPGHLPAATLAVRVRPAGGSDDTVGQAVVSAVDGLFHTFKLDYNRKHPSDDQFSLAEEKTAGGSVKVLKNDKALPTGVRPAYGLRGDYFVFGTSVEAVARFTPPKADAGVKNAPLLRLNATAVVNYLNAHGGEFATWLGGKTGEKADKAKSDLTEFAAVLELFDTLEIHHTGDGTKMSISLKAKTAKALKK